MKHQRLISMLSASLLTIVMVSGRTAPVCNPGNEGNYEPSQYTTSQSAPSLAPGTRLTETDYAQVAEMTNLDVAVIKAVVEVETGGTLCGFWKDGKPMISFSPASFRKCALNHGIDIDAYASEYPEAFGAPDVQKYGSLQAAYYAQLKAAGKIDRTSAIEGTYWGMFQVAGFNWRHCGVSSPDEFVQKMCNTERDHIDMFVNLMASSKMLSLLQSKDLSSFAQYYHGSRGGATEVAQSLSRAYGRYSAATTNAPKAAPARQDDSAAYASAKRADSQPSSQTSGEMRTPTTITNHGLTDEDYRSVAQRLGVEMALIKAVVEVEAGPNQKGFWKEGKPLINFSVNYYKQRAMKRNINPDDYRYSHSVIFEAPDVAKYGSVQAARYAQLEAAMSIDDISGLEGSFWGMFQIGALNWKACGASSIYDFVERMSRSEHEQLELFANFIVNNNLLDLLKSKDWEGFSRKYNGPNYAEHRYHIRLATAYEKFK